MTGTFDFDQPSQGAYVAMQRLLGMRFAAKEIQLQPRNISQSTLSGPVRTRFRGRGMEFEEVRHYQPGDDVRSIDWRVTARTQVPHTKLFREERERPVILMLDQRSDMFFGSQTCFKSVLAAETVALLGWAALANNDRVGALIFDDLDERDIRPRRSRHTQLSILQRALEFNQRLQSPLKPDGHIPLRTRLADLRRIVRPGSALYLISDFHDIDSGCDEQIYQLRRHCDVTLLHLFDPLEVQLPSNLNLTVSDGRRRRKLNAGDGRFAEHYQRSYNHHFEHLQGLSSKLGLPLINLSTAQPLLEQLRPRFGRSLCRS